MEEHEAGPGVTLLELRESGALGGGLGRGAHTAGRVPGGVGVVTCTQSVVSRSAGDVLFYH